LFNIAASRFLTGFPEASRINGLFVAKDMAETPPAIKAAAAGWPPLTPRRAELLPVLPYDRGGRFQSNPDGATLIDKGALGGDPPNDILRGQYWRHPTTTLRRSRVRS